MSDMKEGGEKLRETPATAAPGVDLSDPKARAAERALIEGLLPHRDPFLFVDTIDENTETRIVARHVFTSGEFFFRGHFPEYPVVPGVILIETMAQAGGAGLVKRGILGGSALFFLGTVDKVKFRKQVRPGDEVTMEVENLRVSPRMIKQAGKAYVAGELMAEAEWMCLVGSKGDL